MYVLQVKHLEPWEKGSRKTAGQTGMCGGVSKVLSLSDLLIFSYSLITPSILVLLFSKIVALTEALGP